MFRGLSPRSLTPSHFFLPAILGLVALSTGCPDAAQDYDDYVSMAHARAKAANTGGSGGSGMVATDFDINGKFLAYCLSSLGAGDPKKSLLLSTEFVQKGTDLTVTLDPLLTSAATLSDTAGGTPVTVSTTLDGPRFTINFGSVSIPGKANAISGSDIQVDNTTFQAVVQSSDKLCAELEGQLVKPFAFSLNKPDSIDVCIILRAPADGTLPPRPKAEEFVCGG